MDARMYACTYVRYVFMYACMCACVSMYVCRYVCMDASMYAYMRACMDACMCVWTYACMYVCMQNACVCIYIHMYTKTLLGYPATMPRTLHHYCNPFMQELGRREAFCTDWRSRRRADDVTSRLVRNAKYLCQCVLQRRYDNYSTVHCCLLGDPFTAFGHVCLCDACDNKHAFCVR